MNVLSEEIWQHSNAHTAFFLSPAEYRSSIPVLLVKLSDIYLILRLVFYSQIKTTSPEKFRVHPSISILGVEGMAAITVTVIPDFVPNQIMKEKFLIMCLPVESIDLDSTALSALWKVFLQAYFLTKFIRSKIDELCLTNLSVFSL